KYASQYGKQIDGITRRAQTWLAAYSWPGNVRELENVISLAIMMTEGNLIDLDDLPKSIRTADQESVSQDDRLLTFEELQFRHLQRVLEHVKGDKTRAAEILGISRSTLYNFLSRLNPERH
ncbi:MAG: helix-turn-helix domain-containing protein, partial [Candidatus Acidiferrum sp.]